MEKYADGYKGIIYYLRISTIVNICYYNVKQNTIAKVHFDLLEQHTYECYCVKELCDHDQYALGKKGMMHEADGRCVYESPNYPGPKCETGLYGQAGGWNCVASDQSS